MRSIRNIVVACLLAMFGLTQSRLAPAIAAPLYKILYNFSVDDGGFPGELLLARNGTLYGTLRAGGIGGGTVFALAPPVPPSTQWRFSTIFRLSGAYTGPQLIGPLVEDAQGRLIGVTPSNAMAFVLTPPRPGQTAWTQTGSYDLNPGLESYPTGFSSLVAGRSGQLFGTVPSYGVLEGVVPGTLYRLVAPSVPGAIWRFEVIVDFGYRGFGCPGPLMLRTDPDGRVNLYGQLADCGFNLVRGRVFRVRSPAAGQTNWEYQELANCPECTTDAALVADRALTLYGAQSYKIFKLTAPTSAQTAWTERDLYDFRIELPSQVRPMYGVVEGLGSRLFGISGFGGDPTCQCGEVYSLTPVSYGGNVTPWYKQVLHVFSSSNDDGRYPNARPTVMPDGKGGGTVVGTTLYGGKFNNGTIYQITP